MSDPILDSNPMALVTSAQTQGMMHWSNDKRKEFTKTFADRALSARYILERTAVEVAALAERKHFISRKHIGSAGIQTKVRGTYDRTSNNGGYTVGGRSQVDLEEIAQARAASIAAELPSLVKAVEIINPEIAKKIKARDALIEKGQVLVDKLVAESDEISLSEVDQSMTVGQLRTKIKDQAKLRKKLADEIQTISEEATELDDEINKGLYKGLPGLSEAVMKVINDHLQRADALDTTSRRVGEKVMFGDSEAALELLSHFEQDEIQVNDDIKAQFAKAMEALSLNKSKKLSSKK